MDHLPILGLSKDSEPQNQPENTLRFALNMVHDSVDGSQGSVVNENSNRLCVELDGDICGIIPMNSTHQVVFTNHGCIYKVNTKLCTSELLVKNINFGFSVDYPITGEYRVVRGCEDVIYWRDSLNSDRTCNLTVLSQYPERFTSVNDFSLSPNVSYPNIDTEVLSSGGALDWGAYSFVVELLDDSFNTILRSLPTNPVQIGPGLNLANSTAEEGAIPQSNKSIKLTFTNLDTNFSYLRIGVLRSLTSDGITADAHYVGETIPYSSIKQSYIYRGFNVSNGDSLIDKNSLLNPFIVYDTSKVMEQVQGRLVRANLTEQQVDYSTFQKYASKICTKYVVTDSAHKSEQGDEVKAYGVVYVFRNGTISPIFHIPGRAKLPGDETEIETTLILPPTQEGTTENAALTITATGTKSGDTYTLSYAFSSDIASGTIKLCDSFGLCDIISAATSATSTFTLTDGPSFVTLSIDVITADEEHFTLTTGVKFDFTDEELSLSYQGTGGTSVEYWQLYNTAIKDSTPETGFISSGLMGYYQTGSQYSNPTNFCGIDYWGADCDGNLLVNTNVRHHRLPCRTIEPLSVGTSPRYLGVRFTNVEYPHADIVGHYFVSSTRDETNSTVIAAGYMLPYNYVDESDEVIKEGRYIHYLPQAPDSDSQINSTLQNLVTNEFLFDGKVVQGDFIKINGFYQSSYSQNRKEGNDAYKKIFLSTLPFDNLELYGKHHSTTNFSPNTEFVGLAKSVFLPSKSLVDTIPNRSYTSDFNIITLDNEPSLFNTNRANLNYVYVKSGVPVHNNLFSIRYRLLSEELHEEGDTTAIFNGDVFISKLVITNISSVAIGQLDTTELLQYFIPVVGPALTLFDLINDSDKDVRVEYELIYNLWIESSHDLTYRHQGEDCNRWYDSTTNQSIDDFIIGKIAEIAEPDEEKRRYRLRSSFCNEWYGYNPDLSKINDYRIFRSLSQTYNFCSECLNTYPNRIIWSEKSFEEDVADRYRVFKANNYFDNTPNRGQIYGLTYKQNAILVRTEESAFILQPNPQQLQADGTNVYIGTGDFLSIPPYELASTDLGYGGQQGTLAHANTPYGLIWVDQIRGKVFSHAEGLEEVSRYKMYHWFEQNLKSFLKADFDSAGFTLNFDQIRVAWDAKYERTIIHKTDYAFTELMNTQISIGNVTQAGSKLALKSSPRNPIISQVLEYTNPDYFVNKSFTISYSHRTKTWISFHSYQPDFLLTGANTFGSVKGDSLWMHDDWYNFSQYFGKGYDSIIEFVDRNMVTTNAHAIHYYSQAQKWVDSQWVDANGVTFDKALIYNRNQTTGLVNLEYGRSTLGWSNITKPVIQTDKNYKVAQIRDLAIATPVNTNQWASLQGQFTDGQGYIDIVPNSAAVDLDKPMHELNEMRDKYLIVRLYFSDNEHKLTTHLIHVDTFKSER